MLVFVRLSTDQLNNDQKPITKVCLLALNRGVLVGHNKLNIVMNSEVTY